MAKEPEFKTDRDPSLMKDIIYRTPATGWRPTKGFYPLSPSRLFGRRTLDNKQII